MPFYLCDLVGSGGEDDPWRLALGEWVGDWRGFDCRAGGAGGGGTMVVEAFPGVTEAAAIAADARIAAIDEAAARMLIAAALAERRGR